MDLRETSSIFSSNEQKSKNDNKCLTTIECLPEELILQICSYVAQNSTRDTMNLKMISKTFLRICSDDQVLRCSAYANPPLWWHNITPECESNYLKYMKSLRNAGNPYALFNAGIDNLHNINQDKQNKGLRQLIQAAEGGYMHARYIVGIILYCRGGEEKQKGIDFLTKMTKPSVSMAITLQEIQLYRLYMNRTFRGTYWKVKVYENLKEQYKSNTVKCTCNRRGSKRFKDNCRGLNCWGDGKDIDRCFICQACLSEEIVYQFFYGYYF